MTLLDWLIIFLYAAGLIFLGWLLGRKQKTSEDYYLAGRKLPWLPIGLSTMSTQLSAISFISAPAFVALRSGGGMVWLGYELALPLAMIVLMALFFPVFHSMRIISVYEYLERRFDEKTRVVMSLVFQISRGLATGVAVYAAAIVLSVALQISIWITIVLIGAVAMIYEVFGGIHVDIVSDTIQMIIILAGIIAIGVAGMKLIGGWDSIAQFIDPSRLRAIDFSAHGFGDNKHYGFWPLFFGCFFLYASYYGCDQSQVQRELSTRNLKECKLSLLFNGFFRFPVVFAYCTVGLILGTFVIQNPEFLNKLPRGEYDYLVPTFIMEKMPMGVVGFIFIAIMAAAMSTLDSSINSLSAASMQDIYKKFKKKAMTPRQETNISKIFTLCWGLFCIGFAFMVGNISATIIEAINKIGSIFYGPIFAVFLAGIISAKPRAIPAIVGLVGGVLGNIILWLFFPSVSWLWWNVIGFFISIFFVFIGSLLFYPRAGGSFRIEVPSEKSIWKISYASLILYAAVLIVLLILLPRLF